MFPGPRSALDEGSVHDLWVDASQVNLPVRAPRAPLRAPAPDALVVPDDAADLIADDAYGS
jgi:hypothetical protein